MSDISNIKAVVGTNSWGSKLYEKTLRGDKVDQKTLKKAIQTAIDLDVCMFDTAQDYGLGKAQKMIGKLCPNDILISAKYTPMNGKHEEHQVRNSLEKDLKAMHRDYVDVYWLHLPNGIVDNLREMAELYKEGLIKNIGVSNFNMMECLKAKRVLDEEGVPLYGVQNHYSILARDWEIGGLVDWCQDNHISFWAWAALEEGLLVEPKPDEKKTIMKSMFNKKREMLKPMYEVMNEVAKDNSITAPQVAIAYVANKGIVPICGCRKPYQIEQLHQASNIVLSNEDIKKLEKVSSELNIEIMKSDLFRIFVK